MVAAVFIVGIVREFVFILFSSVNITRRKITGHTTII